MARKTPKYLQGQPVPKERTHLKNKIVAKSTNQKKYIKSIRNEDITFCNGPAGSGKTHLAVAYAIDFLIQGLVDRIVVTRPVMATGESIGYLPGTADMKLEPYMCPVFDEFDYYVSREQVSMWKSQGMLEVAPIGFMRGRSFHNSFIIGDECQNLSTEQMKMFLTRVGLNSKLVVTGDESQSDLPRSQRGAFSSCLEKLSGMEKVGIIHLKKEDIIRNSLIPLIIERLDI